MKIIKEYIQFAIDNNFQMPSWYKIEWNFLIWKKHKTDKNSISIEINKIDIFRIITSKDFIEAIAKGIYNNIVLKDLNKSIKILKYIDIWLKERYIDNTINYLEENIILKQALAIRENKLEDFITNLELLKQNEQNEKMVLPKFSRWFLQMK